MTDFGKQEARSLRAPCHTFELWSDNGTSMLSDHLGAGKAIARAFVHAGRNALQQIQACCQLIEWKLEADGSLHDLFADLQQAQERLCRLFDEMQACTIAPTINLQACDVREVLSAAWTAIEPRFFDRNISWIQVGAKVSSECWADAVELQRTFRSILEYAIVTCDDPTEIKVRYSDTAIGDIEGLEVAVCISRPVFAPQPLEQVFEPFYVPNKEYTCLGLAVAKRVVEAHGGRIAARNGTKKGAEIVVTLPRWTTGRPNKGEITEGGGNKHV